MSRVIKVDAFTTVTVEDDVPTPTQAAPEAETGVEVKFDEPEQAPTPAKAVKRGRKP